jgi:hypothetical protein
MEHYEILDKTDYLSLAVALAVDHVPGFRVGRCHELFNLEHPEEHVRGADGAEHVLAAYGKVLGPKRGRRRKWTPERLDCLLNAVEQIKKKDRLQTDREALVVLARRREWSGPAESGQREWLKTLMNQLTEGRKTSATQRASNEASRKLSAISLREKPVVRLALRSSESPYDNPRSRTPSTTPPAIRSNF